MALVDPNIALSYRGLQLQDPLDQYSKASAAQLNALKMEDMLQEREALKQIQSTIAAKGGPTDLRAAAQAMFKTGRPEFVKTAVSILERLDNQDQFSQYLSQTEGPPANALAAAPAPAAPAPANALAAAPAPAETPPANALAAPAPAATPTSAAPPSSKELERRYRMVSNINTPAAKAEAQLILKQIENEFRASMPPETIRTMTSLGYPATPEGYQAFQSAQRPPQQPRNPIAVLQNGRPTYVDPANAIGQTPLTAPALRIEGLGPSREPPAPSVTQIQDPTNSSQMLTIDARTYKGGGVGSPGVIGLAGKTPAATAAATKKEEGQQQASDILDTLETAYTDLDRRRAVPSERRSAGSNVLSYLAGTSAGQIAGRVVGTEAQTQRDIIQSSRNQLLNAVKNATGMSAQQLNSNVEFRSWLEALSDPTRSIEANRAILENMRKFIANNAKKAEAPASKPSPAPASGGAKADPLGIR
jgi:hypothetical protein